jgi:hypothetical protein
VDRYTPRDAVVDLTRLAVDMNDNAIALEKSGIVAGLPDLLMRAAWDD